MRVRVAGVAVRSISAEYVGRGGRGVDRQED